MNPRAALLSAALTVLPAACASAEKAPPAERAATTTTTESAAARAPHAARGELPAPSPHGSDISTLPSLHPHGAWLPIEAPLLSMQLLTRVKVNGVHTVATLDTGAMSTLMSVPMAMKLGVLSELTPKGREVRALDAHGEVLRGERVHLGELAIGAHRWVDATVIVIGMQPDLFLVGADLLKDVDLYVAADEGLVGLFEPGQAPKDERDVVIRLERGERQLTVLASAPAAKGADVGFSLIVDTGASGTTVPVMTGVNGGLPADLAYLSKTLAVGGEQENRGRFVLAPLKLGPNATAVGSVLAMSSTMQGGEGLGLLGNDVLMRYHSVISFRDGELRLKRPAPRPSFRELGPGGARCAAKSGDERPCIEVQLRSPGDKELPEDSLEDLCLQVDVAPVYAGRTLELALTAEDKGGRQLFNGGALRAYLTVGKDGVSSCFSLWRQLERLGLDDKTRLSLRWVRTEGVIWPCDPLKTECLSFTGPLAKLPLR